MLLLETLVLLNLSILGFALAGPNDRDIDIKIPKTCSATVLTTISITYVPSTVTQLVTVPHSCFTYLEATPQSDNAFCGTSFNRETCPPTPDCILLKTISVPCHDPCCPVTTTIQTPGACASCQVGCGTFTSLVPGGSTGCPTVAPLTTVKGWSGK